MHLVITHDDGRTSTVSMTLRAPDAADGFSTLLWGAEPAGKRSRSTMWMPSPPLSLRTKTLAA